ncbi:hypothetical protein L6452_18088 [Arctium lappa]|uniref:Uncharacterized protein n=1 Tax=Arctium lappa TaxID=4217 RepID=A0ACB9C5C2_ARCLA|nr:hypothetical protein L6452_18088 [Arctium lappa]
MQKGGDSNQQGRLISTSKEITEILWPSEALHDTPLASSHEVGSYFDVVKVLSEVELPLPSPTPATPCSLTREQSNLIGFDVGQSSDSKRKADDDIEGNIERERELKSEQHDGRQHGSQRLATQINTTEKHLQRDKASILGDAVEYIKFLQMQVQMMQTMGVGFMSQGLYMSPTRQPRLQVPNLVPHRLVIPQFGSYFPTNIPIFPPSFSRFPPLVPRLDMGTGSLPWGQTRPPIHPLQLRFPLEASQFVYSTTTPISDTIIPTTFSQAGSTDVLGQPLHHVPATSQLHLVKDPGFTSWSPISVYDIRTSLNRAHSRICRRTSKSTE